MNKKDTLKQYNRLQTMVEKDETELYTHIDFIEKLEAHLNYLDKKVTVEHYRRELGELYDKYDELWNKCNEISKEKDNIYKDLQKMKEKTDE